MAPPIRNIGSQSVGQITATPRRTLTRLAIRVLKTRGVVSKGRRK